MARMLDVSDEVRTHIGEPEYQRLFTETAPDLYDCTGCRAPGDSQQEPTTAVLFLGEQRALVAFAHARCVPSQVVRVSDDQLAVEDAAETAAQPAPAPAPARPDTPTPAQLGITCGLVLVGKESRPALVVEPTGPVARPGGAGGVDEFLPLLIEHGFHAVTDLTAQPATLPGWSVLMAMGRVHAVLQPTAGGGSESWWQTDQPLPVTDEWRHAANRFSRVNLYAAPTGSVGMQPREDLLRDALEAACARGVLVAAELPLAGT